MQSLLHPAGNSSRLSFNPKNNSWIEELYALKLTTGRFCFYLYQLMHYVWGGGTNQLCNCLYMSAVNILQNWAFLYTLVHIQRFCCLYILVYLGYYCQVLLEYPGIPGVQSGYVRISWHTWSTIRVLFEYLGIPGVQSGSVRIFWYTWSTIRFFLTNKYTWSKTRNDCTYLYTGLE